METFIDSNWYEYVCEGKRETEAVTENTPHGSRCDVILSRITLSTRVGAVRGHAVERCTRRRTSPEQTPAQVSLATVSLRGGCMHAGMDVYVNSGGDGSGFPVWWMHLARMDACINSGGDGWWLSKR